MLCLSAVVVTLVLEWSPDSGGVAGYDICRSSSQVCSRLTLAFPVAGPLRKLPELLLFFPTSQELFPSNSRREEPGELSGWRDHMPGWPPGNVQGHKVLHLYNSRPQGC